MLRFLAIYANSTNPLLQPINVLKSIGHKSTEIEHVQTSWLSSLLSPKIKIGLTSWALFSTFGQNYSSLEADSIYNTMPNEEVYDWYFRRALLYLVGSAVLSTAAKSLVQNTRLCEWISNPIAYFSLTGVVIGSWYYSLQRSYSDSFGWKHFLYGITCIVSGALRAPCEPAAWGSLSNVLDFYWKQGIFIVATGCCLKAIRLDDYYSGRTRWVASTLQTVCPIIEIAYWFPESKLQTTIHLIATALHIASLHVSMVWHFYSLHLRGCLCVVEPRGIDPMKEGFIFFLNTLSHTRSLAQIGRAHV